MQHCISSQRHLNLIWFQVALLKGNTKTRTSSGAPWLWGIASQHYQVNQVSKYLQMHDFVSDDACCYSLSEEPLYILTKLMSTQLWEKEEERNKAELNVADKIMFTSHKLGVYLDIYTDKNCGITLFSLWSVQKSWNYKTELLWILINKYIDSFWIRICWKPSIWCISLITF